MTFYEIVLEEFENSKAEHLCDGSETFRKIWMRNDLIKMHADKFISGINIIAFTGIRYIFYCNSMNPRELRLEFLKWCIENKLDI